MALWTCIMCVRECDSSKKAERRVTWCVQVLRSPNLFKKNYSPQEAENAVNSQCNHPVDIHIFHNAHATIAWPQQTLLQETLELERTAYYSKSLKMCKFNFACNTRTACVVYVIMSTYTDQHKGTEILDAFTYRPPIVSISLAASAVIYRQLLRHFCHTCSLHNDLQAFQRPSSQLLRT